TPSTISKLIIPGIQAILLLALIYGMTMLEIPRLRAAEPAQSDRSKTPTIFFPVDSENKSTGYVYVPNDYYALLKRWASGTSVTSPSWLIPSATYAGAMGMDLATDRLEFPEITATYELEILRPGNVFLPLAKDSLSILPGRTTLNGLPIQLE